MSYIQATINRTDMKRISTIILGLLCLYTSLQAQEEKFKFGKISNDELQMTECSFYPEANSMILAKTGILKFIYTDDKGWRYAMDVTVRKKIFKFLDKDQGNIKISLYEPTAGNNREEISGLKATTYNLVDGKLEKIKLPNSEEFKTRINDYRVEVSFALPDVREGSVIEYKYTLTSDYLTNLSTWYFQDELPVAYSDFVYIIPEYFFYQNSQVGNFKQLDVFSDKVSEVFTYTYQGQTSQYSGGTGKGTGTFTSNSSRTQMTGRDILPLEIEPFMNNKPNLPTRVEFQLTSIAMPGRPVQNIASDFESFSKGLMDRADFGKVLDKGGFAKDFLTQLEGLSKREKSYTIYNWISQNFSWNDYYGVTSSNAGRQAFNAQTGTVADINLTLVAVLREAGLGADPVILSTRGHGIPHPFYPNMQDYNYVIVAVSTDEGYYLLDATSRLPFGMLPKRCLNGQGWIVSENGGRWINLKKGSNIVNINEVIEINEDEIRSKYEVKKAGYAAIETYQKVIEKGVELYSSELAEIFTEGTLENFIYPDSNAVSKINLQFEMVSEFYDEDIIYINPLNYGVQTDNPFKREERFSTVDFAHEENTQVLVKINIPEGYKAELPAPSIVRLPNKAGSYIYSASQLGNSVSVVMRMQLNQLDFSPEEYKLLKQFYQMMADKNNETIILKRI